MLPPNLARALAKGTVIIIIIIIIICLFVCLSVLLHVWYDKVCSMYVTLATYLAQELLFVCLFLLYTGFIFWGKFKYPSVLPYGPVTKYNIKITLPIS